MNTFILKISNKLYICDKEADLFLKNELASLFFSVWQDFYCIFSLFFFPFFAYFQAFFFFFFFCIVFNTQKALYDLVKFYKNKLKIIKS